jgi:hypothetical protein
LTAHPNASPAANTAVFPIMSRTSPVIHNSELVIIGTMQAVYGGFAFWLALRASDGALVGCVFKCRHGIKQIQVIANPILCLLMFIYIMTSTAKHQLTLNTL